jgi:geranylgeranyl diphosphate synthase type I
MDFEKNLSKLQKEIDGELQKYLSAAILKVKKENGETGKALEYAAKIILSSGKRIRPILLYFGYIGAGGKEKQKIIKAGVGLEIIHNFLLMHDDIMDHGHKRHGLLTLHEQYKKIAQKVFSDSDPEHFGNSMAIVIGDLIQTLGTEMILNSGFDPSLAAKAVSNLNLSVGSTIIGQIQDIFIENKKQVSEKEVLEMYKNKTAKYTLENPLRLGAILAGAGKKYLEKISRFAIPLGVSFQIQDDILGLFEADKKTGKEMGGDIREGKKTLLVLKALERAGKKEKVFLKKVLGNKNISLAEIEQFQKIVEKTGSLAYSRSLAKNLITDGKNELKKMKMRPESKEFLLKLAEYIVSRKA